MSNKYCRYGVSQCDYVNSDGVEHGIVQYLTQIDAYHV